MSIGWCKTLTVAATLPVAAVCLAPSGWAVPAPEVEYVYNVAVRRHFNFPNNDGLGYGHRICDRVAQGAPYAEVMEDVARDVFPNDYGASNYIVSNAVGILCPANVSALRESAAGYQPNQ